MRTIFAFFLAFAVSAAISCSIPNLEKPECTAARGAVNEFYSYHFGNEMKFSQENLKLRERFLSPELFQSLSGTQGEGDVFTTGTSDIPKAFRTGTCEVTAPDRTRLEVLLFWRDNTRSEQRAIHVEAAKRGDKWLVDKILDR
jgi:hypothetical protein